MPKSHVEANCPPHALPNNSAGKDETRPDLGWFSQKKMGHLPFLRHQILWITYKNPLCHPYRCAYRPSNRSTPDMNDELHVREEELPWDTEIWVFDTQTIWLPSTKNTLQLPSTLPSSKILRSSSIKSRDKSKNMIL